MPADQIQYSEKYFDDVYEYRHVVLPQDIAKLLPKGKLLSETEWRSIGVQQSRGWIHYAIHRPEPHIMLFRRALASTVPPQVPPALLLAQHSNFKELNGSPRVSGGVVVHREPRPRPGPGHEKPRKTGEKQGKHRGKPGKALFFLIFC